MCHKSRNLNRNFLAKKKTRVHFTEIGKKKFTSSKIIFVNALYNEYAIVWVDCPRWWCSPSKISKTLLTRAPCHSLIWLPEFFTSITQFFFFACASYNCIGGKSCAIFVVFVINLYDFFSVFSFDFFFFFFCAIAIVFMNNSASMRRIERILATENIYCLLIVSGSLSSSLNCCILMTCPVVYYGVWMR